MDASTSRLEDLVRNDPVAAPLALLRAEALRSAADPTWERVVPELNPSGLNEDRPLLAGTVFRLDPESAEIVLGRLSVLVRSVCDQAVSIPALPSALDLLEASINQDGRRLVELAVRAEVSAGLLATLGQLLALPLLLACGRKAELALRGAIWQHGYCPVCAAWPLLGEVRGSERERWLRCGRCGTAWRHSHLTCAFCGNDDHETQGYLAPEASMEARRANTCERCRGYLKSVSSLAPMDAEELFLKDLSTLEFDAAAMHRGYGRPETPALDLAVRVEAR